MFTLDRRYYGRYCELEYTTRDCGPVRDGAVFSHRCKLCRCIDGTLACSREATPECSKSYAILSKIAGFLGVDRVNLASFLGNNI